MLEYILKVIENAGYRNLITTERTAVCDADAIHIPDVRSAAFFALGKVKKEREKTALLIDERFVAGAYTALTELWLQREPVLVILYNCSQNTRPDYLKRCTGDIIPIDTKECADRLPETICQSKGPVVLRVAGCAASEPCYDYSEILSGLSKIGYRGKVFVYNACDEAAGLDVSYVGADYKYGLLSKYVGYITPAGSQAVLCIPENVINLESNIFDSRFISDRFKTVVSADASGVWNKTQAWIAANGIRVSQTDRRSAEAALQRFLSAEAPAVLYVK